MVDRSVHCWRDSAALDSVGSRSHEEFWTNGFDSDSAIAIDGVNLFISVVMLVKWLFFFSTDRMSIVVQCGGCF